MKRYDYFAKIQDTKEIKECARFFKEMGWDGVVVSVPYDKFEDMKKAVKCIRDIDIIIGIEISPKNRHEAKKLAKIMRTKSEILVGIGGTPDKNRAILETPEFDILAGHMQKNRTLGINHIMSRLSKKNDISICLDFNPILLSSGKTRSETLSALIETARMINKYHSPFVVCSGALSKWDIRPPHELSVFGKLLGLDENEIKRNMSGKIVNKNRKIISGKIIMKGVEMED